MLEEEAHLAIAEAPPREKGEKSRKKRSLLSITRGGWVSKGKNSNLADFSLKGLDHTKGGGGP